MLARWAQFCKDCYIISTCTPSCPATAWLWGLAQAGAWLCYPLRWLSIYNKEWDITVIQPISSTSTSELFRKVLVDIWIDLCTILSIIILFKTTRPRAYLLPHWKLLFVLWIKLVAISFHLIAADILNTCQNFIFVLDLLSGIVFLRSMFRFIKRLHIINIAFPRYSRLDMNGL